MFDTWTYWNCTVLLYVNQNKGQVLSYFRIAIDTRVICPSLHSFVRTKAFYWVIFSSFFWSSFLVLRQTQYSFKMLEFWGERVNVAILWHIGNLKNTHNGALRGYLGNQTSELRCMAWVPMYVTESSRLRWGLLGGQSLH